MEPIFVEFFDGGDAASWPAGWFGSDHVIAADVVGGAGRLAGTMGFVGRMVISGSAAVDVDATLVVTFDDPDHQGGGLYVRQNGGALHETEPPGEGYEVYLEGDVVQTLSVWREVDGNETIIASVVDPIAMGIEPGIPYALRLQCVQAGAITELRAKAWPADEVEPSEWMLETTDGTPQLQNAAGGFAVDIYNYFGANSIYVDDIVVMAP